MHILFPMHSLEKGGGCRVVAEAANGLVARGHTVTVALPEGAPISWFLTANVLRVPKLAAEFLPPADVVVATFYTTVPAAAATGRPVIRFCLGFEPMWVPDPQVALSGYQLPHPIITISTWLQEILKSRLGRSSHLVHPGVDSGVFHPRGNKGRYGYPTVAFLLRGSGYTWKGAPVFWQAMSVIRRRRPEVKLLIIANEEAIDVGIPVPHLTLRAPGDDELAAIYSAADIFVFPSLFEGFGLPPLEAMACGTAVVCTDSGGVRDYARHGQNCLIVQPGRPEPLASAILSLLSNPGMRRNLAAGGLATAAVWNWHRMYDEMSYLVPALAGRP